MKIVWIFFAVIVVIIAVVIFVLSKPWSYLSVKEPVKRYHIEIFISQELLKNKKFELINNHKFNELLKINKLSLPKNFKFTPLDLERMGQEIIIDTIIFTWDRYEKIINDNLDKGIQYIIESDKALVKLKQFLINNTDVSNLPHRI